MKVLYGVVGEGMGHATRSKVVISHLVSCGHEVQIVVSGRAHDYLKRFFPEVDEISGLTLSYEGNAVKRSKTVASFLRNLPAKAENLETMERLHSRFKADAVVSDFETFAYLFGQRYRIPVISIDNMQVLDRCALEVEIPKGERLSFTLAKAIVKTKLPGCLHYLVTSFFFPPVRKDRTSLFPPILRDEILAARSRVTEGEHVLVYQTADQWKELVPTLQKIPGRFVVYGLKRDESLGNVTLKNFSEAGFVDDLASARGVITGGGFSLMSEAVYLGKPILSVPIQNQFEQTLNALYLEKLGYGAYVKSPTARSVLDFLERREAYAKAVARHEQKGNSLIFSKIDELLAGI
ncbi:hypothetical protein HY251_21765 [bacterium]|nr:hypothetical protein [bacterium]